MTIENNKTTGQDYTIICDLIERQLDMALKDCHVLREQERAKKEARKRIALISNEISSARHHLGRLEALVD